MKNREKVGQVLFAATHKTSSKNGGGDKLSDKNKALYDVLAQMKADGTSINFIKRISSLIEILIEEKLPELKQLNFSPVPFTMLVPIGSGYTGHSYILGDPVIFLHKSSPTRNDGYCMKFDGNIGAVIETSSRECRIANDEEITSFMKEVHDDVIVKLAEYMY